MLWQLGGSCAKNSLYILVASILQLGESSTSRPMRSGVSGMLAGKPRSSRTLETRCFPKLGDPNLDPKMLIIWKPKRIPLSLGTPDHGKVDLNRAADLLDELAQRRDAGAHSLSQSLKALLSIPLKRT